MKPPNRTTKALLVIAFAALCAAWESGCIVAAPPPAPITVELSNSTMLDVRPRFFVSAAASTAGGLFVGGNLVTDFTQRAFPELRAGETVTLTFECDQALSLGVDEPTLFDASTLIVQESTDRIFQLRDTNYSCGGRIRFVYVVENDVFRVHVEFP
jgi:hypothetical protein